MKDLFVFAALLSVLLAVSGCSRSSENDLWAKAEHARTDQNYDSTIQLCQKILQEYPEGKKAPEALYSIAETYHDGLHNFRAAISYYSLFAQKYPNDSQAPTAMFLIGYTYNNDLQMIDSARDAYQRFLEKFPGHELAPSARFELSTLGKSPEDLIPPEADHPKKEKTSSAKRHKPAA